MKAICGGEAITVLPGSARAFIRGWVTRNGRHEWRCYDTEVVQTSPRRGLVSYISTGGSVLWGRRMLELG